MSLYRDDFVLGCLCIEMTLCQDEFVFCIVVSSYVVSGGDMT